MVGLRRLKVDRWYKAWLKVCAIKDGVKVNGTGWNGLVREQLKVALVVLQSELKSAVGKEIGQIAGVDGAAVDLKGSEVLVPIEVL